MRHWGFIPVPPAGIIPLVPGWAMSTEGEQSKEEATEMATKRTDGKWLKPIGWNVLLSRPASEDTISMGVFPEGHDWTEGEDLSNVEVVTVPGSDELRQRVVPALKQSDAAPAVYEHVEAALPDVVPGEV